MLIICYNNKNKASRKNPRSLVLLGRAEGGQLSHGGHYLELQYSNMVLGANPIYVYS